MVEVTQTAGTLKLRNSGDQKKIIVDVTDVQNNYTLTVPHLTDAEDFHFAPTTEVDWGITVSENVLTFLTSTTIAGRVVVYGR